MKGDIYMLTTKQNLLETIRGGHPDRFVNQYEFMHIIYGSPFFDLHNGPIFGRGRSECSQQLGDHILMAKRNAGGLPCT